MRGGAKGRGGAPRGKSRTTRARRAASAATLSGAFLLTAGCVRHIDMEAAPAANSPTASSSRVGNVGAHATVLYTGVRDASRRYADYGVIDRTVLQNAENP